MADIAQLERALINADKAGDTQAAMTLAAEIKRMRATTETPKQETSLWQDIKQGAGNLAAGGLRGAGSIGATILYPWDKAQDLYYGDRGPNITGIVTGKQPLSRNQERRQQMDAALRSMGAETDSWMYQGGKLAGEIAGTAGAGGVLANGLRAVAPGATALTNAIATGGMRAGSTPGAANMATRIAGGTISGGASAGLVNPEDALTGAAVGGALPPALAGFGKVGSMIGSKIAGPAVPEPLRKAAKSAINAGYVIPPTQVTPSLKNRLLEGFAGKLTTAQNASAKNQAITNDLVKRELGIAPTEQITVEALDGIRAEAGKAYQAISGLGKFNATGANLPKNVAVQESIDPFLRGKAQSVDSAELIRAWKQANHDATAYYRAYARDANPETLAKAKAASGESKAIDKFLEQKLKDIGADDMLQALKDARVTIAKTYSAEGALNPVTGNIDANQFAKLLKKQKPLSGGMRTAGEFAAQFPKAAQPVERMGSLPQVSPLDFGTFGLLSGATSNPAMMAGILARPVARSAVLSKSVQNGLLAQPGQGRISGLLSNPELEQLIYRTGPVIAADR